MIWLNFSAVSTLHGSLRVEDAEGTTKTDKVTAADITRASLHKRIRDSSTSTQGDNLPCRITLVWSKLHISKTPVQRPPDLAGGDNRHRDMGRYLPHRDWICPYPVSKGREGLV